MEGDVRAVFFDAGYTLLCMQPDQQTIFVRACDYLEISVNRSQLETAIDKANAALSPRVPAKARLPFCQSKVDRFWTDYHRAVLAACAVRSSDVDRARELYHRFTALIEWRIYDEVRPLLAALQERNIVLGVISNWTGDLEEVLRRMELREAFDFVLDSARLGHEKPHPEIFQEALRRSGVSAAHALHVGDSPKHDVAGALNSGLRAVLLDRHARHINFSGVPRVSTLDQLLDLDLV